MITVSSSRRVLIKGALPLPRRTQEIIESALPLPRLLQELAGYTEVRTLVLI